MIPWLAACDAAPPLGPLAVRFETVGAAEAPTAIAVPPRGPVLRAVAPPG